MDVLGRGASNLNHYLYDSAITIRSINPSIHYLFIDGFDIDGTFELTSRVTIEAFCHVNAVQHHHEHDRDVKVPAAHDRRTACNKYREGTSDATTSSLFIVSLIMMSFDEFLPSKTAIFVIRK